MDFSRRALLIMQYALFALMGLTAGLLVWNHYGMERIVELSARSGVQFDVSDDRILQGDSVATVKRVGDNLIMNCKISTKTSWPFCKFVFYLGKGDKGMDLSQFEYVSYDLRFSGVGNAHARSLILNYEPEISNVNDWMSQKINEAEFDIPKNEVIKLPLKVFHTAPWWNALRKVPLLHTDTRIDNVIAVELNTGDAGIPGEHVVELRSIKFHGKWISQNQLLMALVGVWIAFAVTWPVLNAYKFRAELKFSKQRLAALDEVNKALQLETKELAGQVSTDPLTGALNRQGLRALLMKNWTATSLMAEPVVVIFADLDHFKQVNDQHGHDVGDQVLRLFVSTVSSTLRATDNLVRWGGEEFLIICPCTSAEQGCALADKVRLAMHRTQWPLGLKLTSSFGVAVHLPGEEIGVAIKRADVALYKAKENGRDRIET
ncbi:MAG: GGDEF domain-containing protein [Massilia sp.]